MPLFTPCTARSTFGMRSSGSVRYPSYYCTSSVRASSFSFTMIAIAPPTAYRHFFTAPYLSEVVVCRCPRTMTGTSSLSADAYMRNHWPSILIGTMSSLTCLHACSLKARVTSLLSIHWSLCTLKYSLHRSSIAYGVSPGSIVRGARLIHLMVACILNTLSAMCLMSSPIHCSLGSHPVYMTAPSVPPRNGYPAYCGITAWCVKPAGFLPTAYPCISFAVPLQHTITYPSVTTGARRLGTYLTCLLACGSNRGVVTSRLALTARTMVLTDALLRSSFTCGPTPMSLHMPVLHLVSSRASSWLRPRGL